MHLRVCGSKIIFKTRDGVQLKTWANDIDELVMLLKVLKSHTKILPKLF